MYNGNYDAWCADHSNDIFLGTGYTMDAMSSLYPSLLQGDWNMKGDQLAACNWLFNNLDDYSFNSTQMQDAIWNIFDGTPCSGVAFTMASDALGHTDYTPLPGGWAAIVMFDVNDDPFDEVDHTQITFFVVDP